MRPGLAVRALSCFFVRLLLFLFVLLCRFVVLPASPPASLAFVPLTVVAVPLAVWLSMHGGAGVV